MTNGQTYAHAGVLHHEDAIEKATEMFPINIRARVLDVAARRTSLYESALVPIRTMTALRCFILKPRGAATNTTQQFLLAVYEALFFAYRALAQEPKKAAKGTVSMPYRVSERVAISPSALFVNNRSMHQSRMAF
jgi:hypothetical protein